jgi:hypothetical protein
MNVNDNSAMEGAHVSLYNQQASIYRTPIMVFDLDTASFGNVKVCARYLRPWRT